MRALLAGLPIVALLAAACGSPDDASMGATTEGLARHAAGCSISRSQILSAASPARKVAIQRGLAWLDAHVPYSQSKSHQGYRMDCSGFVSMCWQLGTSTNTSAMVGGAYNVRLGSYADLLPADALLRNGHVSLFVGWNDAAHTSACLLEEGSSSTGTQMRSAAASSLKSQGFKAVRAKDLVGDTAANPPDDNPPADNPPADNPDDPGAGNGAADDPGAPDPAPQAPPADPGPDPAPPADGADPADGASCWSNTLGEYVQELACVHSVYDDADEQCHDGLWYRGVSGGAGRYGACAFGP